VTPNPFAVALVLLSAVAAAGPAHAGADDARAGSQGTPEQLYQRYLAAARATARGGAARSDWMATLATDARAREVNDLVTVRVVERIEALGTADSKLTKDGSGSVSVPHLFGLEEAYPDWLNPAPMAQFDSTTKFKGGGATSRTSELSATLTARVVEVLPNGDLVLEGAREIDINGDQQVVVLTGVVRPADITRSNVVLSTRVGELRIRYFGQGLMKDNLKPGWLVRLLNKVF
jgi:flagellar L-ring protein precursor FlgH